MASPDLGLMVFGLIAVAALLVTVLLVKQERERRRAHARKLRQAAAVTALTNALLWYTWVAISLTDVATRTAKTFHDFTVVLREATDAEAELLPRLDP